MKRKRKSTKSKARKPVRRRKTIRKTGTKTLGSLKKARLKKTISSIKTSLKHLEKEIR
jgi:hypothetical protein